MNRTLKKLTIVLIILLISAISFGGLYVKKLNKMENIIPSYTLGTDFKGKRNLSFKVSETQKEESNVEETENTTNTEENVVEENSTSEENKETNGEEVLTKENYEKVKEILQKRLDTAKVEEYYIRTNTENGDFVVEIPENAQTEIIYSLLASKGDFSIIDKETEEVLIDGDDVKNTQVLSNTTELGTTLYLQINFDKEGTEKLKEISNTYVKQDVEKDENTDAESVDTENVVAEENVTENTTTEENVAEDTTAKEEETKISYVSIKIDDATLTTTYFGEEIPTGVLQLPLAQNLTDSASLNQYYQSLAITSNIINSGELPIAYELSNDNYVKSEIDIEILKMIIYVVIAIFAVGAIVLIIKYRVNGIFAAILEIGYVAILLITIRYTNVALNIGGIIAIIASAILNYVFLVKYLNKQDTNTRFSETMKEYFIMLVPVCVIAIVFTFVTALNISTIGMVMFWGLLILVLYNLIFTKSIYSNKAK